jgi:tRNA-dihydrouridine synthase
MLCQKQGAEATCVPLVNSTAISRNPIKADEIDAKEEEKNIGIQIVGNVPEELVNCAKTIEKKFPFVKWLNINCGCPSVRTMHCGGGGAMLNHPQKIYEAVKSIQSSITIPISIKMRIKDNLENTIKIAKGIEEAGADKIILHGRSASQGYSGKANWELIKGVKEAISIPLVGNGDLQNAKEGEEKVNAGFCDSYMIARAAMNNPKIFQNKNLETDKERAQLFFQYIEIGKKFDYKISHKDLKLKAMNFVSGSVDASKKRLEISRTKEINEINKIFIDLESQEN